MLILSPFKVGFDYECNDRTMFIYLFHLSALCQDGEMLEKKLIQTSNPYEIFDFRFHLFFEYTLELTCHSSSSGVKMKT